MLEENRDHVVFHNDGSFAEHASNLTSCRVSIVDLSVNDDSPS